MLCWLSTVKLTGSPYVQVVCISRRLTESIEWLPWPRRCKWWRRISAPWKTNLRLIWTNVQPSARNFRKLSSKTNVNILWLCKSWKITTLISILWSGKRKRSKLLRYSSRRRRLESKSPSLIKKSKGSLGSLLTS